MKMIGIVLIIAAFACTAAAQEKMLTCVNKDSPNLEEPLILNESLGVANFGDGGSFSTADFTDTTITWSQRDGVNRTWNYRFSRVTGTLVTGLVNGYGGGTWLCDTTQKKF